MARQDQNTQVVVGPYPTSVGAGDLEITYLAADTINFEQSKTLRGDEILLMHVAVGGAGGTVDISSTADRFNRTADIASYAIAAGETHAFAPGLEGWQQSDKKLYFQGSDASIGFAVLRRS